MKIKSKPVIKEAFELQQSFKNWPEWAIEALSANTIITHNMGKFSTMSDFYAEIKTLEGVMKVESGDFVIQGLKGELYPCKPDVFWNTYDEVIEANAVIEKPTAMGSTMHGMGFR